MKKQLLGASLALGLLTACGSEPAATDADDQQEDQITLHQITVELTPPANAPTVYLTGNLPTLGPWDPAALAMDGEGDLRTATVEVPDGFTFEYKFTLGSWDREGVGPSGTVLPNFTLTATQDQKVAHTLVDFKKDTTVYIEDWQNSGVEGTLIYWLDQPSAFLSETRHVSIWLPPGYEDNPDQDYPVIYMSDGQNLFDPRIANTGIDWGVDEAIMAGVRAGTHEPAIVVASWSTSRRAAEYSPWHDAPNYARFVKEELMPRINAEFRVRTDRESTFHMGSSMGGLLSFYMVKEHSETFSACGCVSTHVPINPALVADYFGLETENADDTRPYIETDIANGDTMPEGVRLFFDYGTETLDAEYGPVHGSIRAWLLEQGFVEGEDFLIREYEGAAHNEASWRARLQDQMVWLLAKQVPAER